MEEQTVNYDVINAELLELDSFYARFEFLDEEGNVVYCVFDSEALHELKNNTEDMIKNLKQVN